MVLIPISRIGLKKVIFIAGSRGIVVSRIVSGSWPVSQAGSIVREGRSSGITDLGLFWCFFCLLGFPSERITHLIIHLGVKDGFV
jgi:hypothetical protein